MSPGCHHVYCCLYMSATLRSIFGSGLGLCQLLSSVLPEGPTPTVLSSLTDLSGQHHVPFTGADTLDLSAWPSYKDRPTAD